jgi:hypothetical protein
MLKHSPEQSLPDLGRQYEHAPLATVRARPSSPILKHSPERSLPDAPVATVRARPSSPMLRHSPERSLPDNFFRSSAPGPLPGKSRRVGFAEVTSVRPDASSASTPRHRGGASPALPSKNESEGRGRAETPFTVAQVLLARNKSARELEGSLPIPAPGPSFSAARSYPSPGLSPSSGTSPTHRMPASTAPEPRSLCA